MVSGEKSSCGRTEQASVEWSDCSQRDSDRLPGDSASLATDGITKEWFVKVHDSATGEPQMLHVTIADHTSLNPDTPRIVVGVNEKKWSAVVQRSFIAGVISLSSCLYSWELDGHRFNVVLDDYSLFARPDQLQLLVDGHEVNSKHPEAYFLFRRYMSVAMSGIFWLLACFAIAFLSDIAVDDEERSHNILLKLCAKVMIMATLVSFSVGSSYFIFGFVGILRFGTATVMLIWDKYYRNGAHPRLMEVRFPGNSRTVSCCTLKEDSTYSGAKMAV